MIRIRNKFLIVFLLLIFISIGVVLSLYATENNKNDFGENRDRILSQLYSNIEKAREEGKYRCCIEPPCTMCYLGNWIWEDGTCNCDGMIENEEWDKVCPQCVKGIKEGRCKSKSDSCPIL